MQQVDRRTMMALVAAGGLLPGAALAAERRVFKASIAIEDGCVLVAVGMNGKGPYIFMIDTGQYVSMIRPDLAKQLKLPVQGHETTRGIGGKGRPFTLYLARDFVIGGGIRQDAVVLQDSFEFGYRQGIYGGIAAGILTAMDADLDFDAGELRLYPDGRGDRPGYVAVDSEIPRPGQIDRGSQKIFATVMLDGRPIRCALDTGAPATLYLGNAAARRLGLWDHPFAPRLVPEIAGSGSMARIVRAASMGMGDLRVDRPLITVMGNNVGTDYDAIVGLSFLRRANLSIDTHGRRLWVAPSRQVIPPDRYGLTGLWLGQNGAAIEVEAVGDGSPAANAGIAPGDRIEGDWGEVRRAINGPAGSVARLTVSRGSSRREVVVTLADYL